MRTCFEKSRVALGILLLALLFIVSSPFASGKDNPYACNFQTVNPTGLSVMQIVRTEESDDHFDMDDSLVSDKDYPYLHKWTAVQFAAVDVLEETRPPFKDGGVVVWSGFDDVGGGGHGVAIKGTGTCSNWYATWFHLPSRKYSVGESISGNELIGKPGCSGFDCNKIITHNHFSLLYCGSEKVRGEVETMYVNIGGGKTCQFVHPARYEPDNLFVEEGKKGKPLDVSLEEVFSEIPQPWQNWDWFQESSDWTSQKFSALAERFQEWKQLAEIARFLAKVNWTKLGAITVAVLVAAVLVWILSKLGLKSRRLLIVVVGLVMLAYAWGLPKEQVWKESPIQRGSYEVLEYYADPRRNPEGATGITYQVDEKLPVIAVISGEVVSLEGSPFGSEVPQLWLRAGNGLYVQYKGLSELQFEVGDKINKGELVGYSIPSIEFRFGVSSKSPSFFSSQDDRGWGFVNPENYLGKSVMSGLKREESAFTILGWVLVLLGLLWPAVMRVLKVSKILGADFAAPYGGKTMIYHSFVFMVATIVLAVGLIMDSPYLKWIAQLPFWVSLFYLLSRRGYRREVRRLGLTPRPKVKVVMLAKVGKRMTLVWVVLWLVLAGVNPRIVYARRSGDFELEFPKVVLPPLPVTEGGEEQQEEDWDFEYDPNDPVFQEFNLTYWTGSPVRFYVEPIIWDAALKAAEKYPGCDPYASVVVAHSESPVYKNYTSENYATASGRWQFIRDTWNDVWNDQVDLTERSNTYKAAEAFCRYDLEKKGGALSNATTEAEWVNAFAVQSPVWNSHMAQARYAWRAMHGWKARVKEDIDN